ncbi:MULTISPECIES: hypothetical protein [Streptomyces]|nr:hypothetical protein [Streptomyces sp. XC 2026]
MTRDGITEHGTRGVVVSVSASMPVPEGEATRALIENALCS